MSEIYVKIKNKSGKYFTTINNAVRYLSSPRTPPAQESRPRPQTAGPRNITKNEQKRLVGTLTGFLNNTEIRNLIGLSQRFKAAGNSEGQQKLILMNMLRTVLKANRNFIKTGSTVITAKTIVNRIPANMKTKPVVRDLIKKLLKNLS